MAVQVSGSYLIALSCHFRSRACHWVKGLVHDIFTSTRQRISVPDKAAKNIRVGANVIKTIKKLWIEESGQDVAEYAVMLAVILVIVVGTVRLIGGNANNVFSQVSSQIQ